MRNNLVNSAAQIAREYATKVRAFRPNARLYLVNVIISGISLGVFRLLFNFYVLSLGFNEALLGQLITVGNLTALIVALPVGFLSDRFGRKNALLLGGAITSLSILGMVLWPSEAIFYAMNALMGFAQSLWMITMAPFLMENSGEEERTYLFSFGWGLQMLAGFVGNWVGGYLPSWMGDWQGIPATDSLAYGWSLGLVGAMFALGILPLLIMRVSKMEREERSILAPLAYAKEKPKLLAKLVLPLLVTSIGAGLIMPFMNVFFRVVHEQPDQVIGSLFAWGSLAMGIGLMAAPAVAERIGKIQLVVLTQALSVPFLVLLGFAPWFWVSAGAYYVRLTLMNMSSPVYQTFVMEQVETKARATVASLTSMAWNFGWALSPTVSGILQVKYGFGPPFLGTITLYIIAITMYWAFFLRGWEKNAPKKTSD